MHNNFKSIDKIRLSLFISVVIVVILLAVVLCIHNFKLTASQSNNTDIKIENILADKVLCIGELVLEKGSEYIITVTTKTESDVFVALNEMDNITDSQGIVWTQYHGSIGKKLEAKITDINTGTYYVYVGSKGKDTNNITYNINKIK